MGTSLDCLLMLDPDTVALLGSGPFCRFTSPTALAVTLGSEAAIMPVGTATPDFISLGSGAIGSAVGEVLAQAVLGLQSRR